MPEDTTAPKATRTGPKVVNLGDSKSAQGEDAKGTRAKGQAPRAKAAAPAAKQRTPKERKLAESIAGVYQGAGLAIIGVAMSRGDEGIGATGAKMVERSETLAEAWMDYADQNPKVKAALQRFTESTALGVLVVMHVSLLTPLAVSRGVIPVQFAQAMDGQMFAQANGNGAPSQN